MSQEEPIRATQILDFWLGPEGERDAPAADVRKRWFGGGPELDARLAREFGEDLERAARGDLDAWTATPRGTLALVIVLDQWTRNIRRGSGRMFENDTRAISIAKQALDRGDDARLAAAERNFLYMPFMHAESLDDQRRALELFAELARIAPTLDVRSFAQAHHDIVARFGRFPHRNALLGRSSTAEETQFLLQPNSSF
jgi:uncharacterized protein (DUF924 family)